MNLEEKRSFSKNITKTKRRFPSRTFLERKKSRKAIFFFWKDSDFKLKAFRNDKDLIRAFEGVDAKKIRREIMKATAKSDREDKQEDDTPDYVFERFQAIIRSNPDQVIRYRSRDNADSKNQSPLWISGQGHPASMKVPKCQQCGAEREFEFQIMPQTLNYLDLDPLDEDSLDWGVIAIFTCSNSCGEGEKAYFEEHVHCQIITGS
mmetsp:Transcript_4334/g.10159  ORF Transcript_4334/g.10159 Transcript_4334/m.10159 type:complete len:206 (+) Transcript_4334:963-1580(+)